MFDQTADQPYRRRGLSKKGWARMLLFYMVVSVALIFWFRHLAEKDAQIATRESVGAGVIVKIHKGKNDTADYTFQFEGKSYQGHDDCDYLNLTVGGNAKVFIDPQNPTENGLRSFAFKNTLNHSLMTFAIYLSFGLAFASAILWTKVRNEGSPEDKETV